MQVAKRVIHALDRHTFLRDDVPGEWLRDFVKRAIDIDLVAIQVFHLTLVAKQSLLK